MRHFRHFFAVASALALVAVGCELVRTPEECDADLDAMFDVVESSVASASACQRDSDCVLFDPSNNCFGSCPVTINAVHFSRVDKEIAQGDIQFCHGFAEQCGYSQPSCPQLEPACQQGQCVLVDRTGGP